MNKSGCRNRTRRRVQNGRRRTHGCRQQASRRKDAEHRHARVVAAERNTTPRVGGAEKISGEENVAQPHEERKIRGEGVSVRRTNPEAVERQQFFFLNVTSSTKVFAQ